jgi:hypothetical protein
MADDFYQQLQDIATGVFKQFSQGKVQIIRTVEVPGQHGWEPGSRTTKKLDLYATVTGVKAYKVDGKQIVMSDQVVTCAAKAANGELVNPVPTDQLTVDGKVRQIKKIEQQPASGTPVSFAIYIAG